MSFQRWLPGLRLCGAFLLAPALVPLALQLSLSIIVVHFHLGASNFTGTPLGLFVQTYGVGLVYLGALCFGVPYVVLVRNAGRLTFSTVLLPTLLLSWVYPVVIYFALQRDFPYAGTVAAACVPGVLLAGLCFYAIGVWKSRPSEVQVSLLLETYAAPQKPTLQT